MKKYIKNSVAVGVLALCAGAQAQISDGVVKIGVLTDMAGPYSGMGGAGSVVAARMAGEDCLKAECKDMKIEVVSADQLDAKVAELTQALCNASPNAVRSCKRLLQEVAGRDIEAPLIALTVEGIADIRASVEGKEGVQSFLQKRKPSWLA